MSQDLYIGGLLLLPDIFPSFPFTTRNVQHPQHPAPSTHKSTQTTRNSITDIPMTSTNITGMFPLISSSKVFDLIYLCIQFLHVPLPFTKNLLKSSSGMARIPISHTQIHHTGCFQLQLSCIGIPPTGATGLLSPNVQTCTPGQSFPSG